MNKWLRRVSGLLLCALLLAACQAPTRIPVATQVEPEVTPSPFPVPGETDRASPPASPSPVPPRPPERLPPEQGQPVNILPAPVCCLAADPFDRRAVYALLANDHFYVSPDRGQTWLPLPLPHPDLLPLEAPAASVGPSRVYASPYRPGLLFVHARGSLFRSPDRGLTWQEISSQVGAWTVLEDNDRLHLYAWRSGLAPNDHGLFRSVDEGESWEPLYTGFFPPPMQSEDADRSLEGMLTLAADPAWEEFIYAGTNYGIFRSQDGGRNWQPFDSGLPPVEGEIRRTPQLLAGGAGKMYALTEGLANGGESEFLLARLAHGQLIPDDDTWEVVARGDLGGRKTRQGMGFYGVFALEIDPLDEGALYLATMDGLLGSRDGGAHFSLPSAARASRPVYRVEAAPGVPTRLYLSTAEGFASLPVAWPGQGQTEPAKPWPQFTPQVDFQVREHHGGDLTAYALDQTAGPNAGMAYVGTGSSLALMDLDQETVPDLWSSVDLQGELAKSIAVSPGRVYLLSGEGTLRAIDVSDRANPRQLEKIRLPNPALSLAVHDQTLIVSEQICTPSGCTGGLRLFDAGAGLRELVFLPAQAPVERLEFAGDTFYAFEQDCREWACSAGLRVVDLSAEPLPRAISYLELPGRVTAAGLEGDYLYVAHESGLLALDVSNPARPVETNALDLQAVSGRQVTGMALSQGYAYLTGGWPGMDIYSLADPGRPRFVKTWQQQGGAGFDHLLANGEALYASETYGEFGHCETHLFVLDLSDPENPRPLGTPQARVIFACASPPRLAGERLVLNDWYGLHVLDLTDPFELRSWTDYAVSGRVDNLSADEMRLFWSNPRAEKSLYGMDVRDPEHASLAGPLPSTWSGELALNINYLYVPAWWDGLKVLDVSEYGSPVTLKTLVSEDLGGSPQQAVLAGRYLYLALAEGGLRILEVSDPSRPRLLGRFDLPDFSINDLAVAGDTAYLLVQSWSSEIPQGEVLILDVGDPARPRRARGLAWLPGERPASLATGGDWLYLGGQACPPDAPGASACAGRLASYSLANPLRPERAGQIDLPEGVVDIALEGDSGYLAAGPAGVWALDLRDPARPVIAGQLDIPSGAQALAVVFSRVYVAAGSGGLVVLDLARK